MPSQQFNLNMRITAPSLDEAKERLSAVNQLLNTLTTENLLLMAEKSKMPGINEKITQLKHFI